MPSYGYIETLEFDLPSALLGQLVGLFEEMSDGQLAKTMLDGVPEEQGVYQIYLNGELEYIGKTDSDAGLKKRLERHSKKILCRHNLNPTHVTFKAVRLLVFSAVDIESLLIAHYRKQACPLSWQNSGFGANDPGRKRDTSYIKNEHFDAKFPIDLNTSITVPSSVHKSTVADALQRMKGQLPYLIRFQRPQGTTHRSHPDFTDTNITLTPKIVQTRLITTRDHLKLRRPLSGIKKLKFTCIPNFITVYNYLKMIKHSLGSQWQITVLPGYIIIY
jgi:hypothetical protein